MSVVEAVHFAPRYEPQDAVEILEPVQRLLDVDEPHKGNNGDWDTPDHTREEEDVLDDGEAALYWRNVVGVGVTNGVGIPPKLLHGLMAGDVVNHDEAKEESKDEPSDARKVVHVGKETDEEERDDDQTEILEQFDGGIGEQTPVVEDEHEEERDDSKLPCRWSNLHVSKEQSEGIYTCTMTLPL